MRAAKLASEGHHTARNRGDFVYATSAVLQRTLSDGACTFCVPAKGLSVSWAVPRILRPRPKPPVCRLKHQGTRAKVLENGEYLTSREGG
ncbi:hypothetical protein TNIN_242261 [Trichonephila inaurata madagascariensis]|uniref:Uncharacterized protein n=1 Tax=Trichonephila inaurata madagascariensis TaxID=2747483 RepID=A0A8X6XPR9_9ARAC|nr:hypothetical protein TNIN_242261 [Trichonephila inaurata madagascariensis]